MPRLSLSVVAVAAVCATVTTAGDRSQAGVIAPIGLRAAAYEQLLTETVQFTWGGRRYCWYNGGWRGAGWYWCGYNLRRGLGWGGPLGWHGWRRPGHHRPSKPGRPGIQRPRPLPATRG